MQGPTQAQAFIKTLEDLLDAELELRRAQKLRQHKANAKRYMRAFPAALDESREQSEWLYRDNGSGLQVVAQMESD